jgi:hypothetical protein
VLYDNDPTPTHRRYLAITTRSLAAVARDSGQLDRAADLLDEARTLLQVLYDNDPTPTHRRYLAITTRELGLVARDRGD